MKKKYKQKRPPRLAVFLFRWFCHPTFVEEIEGDLIEQFNQQSEKYNSRKARLLFIKEVLLLFRPGIIFNFSYRNTENHSNTRRLQWIKLLSINLLFILFNLIPFFPGPYTGLSIGLSMIGRIAGFFGLLLVPIGLCWLVMEICRIRKQKTSRSNWTNGYYLSIIATCISVLIYILPSIVASLYDTIWAGILFFLILVPFLHFVIPAIRKLKKTDSQNFNPAPLYLLSIPALALATNLYLVEPASNYSRSHAINNSSDIIAAIENYKLKYGSYPESLDELSGTFLHSIPRPSIMGINKFEYSRFGEAYNLSFVQWVHFGATEEVVMYNKYDQHNSKGYFASFNAKEIHWKYFWLD